MVISHVSECRAEEVARELLSIRGWNTAKPPKGDVLWKNEYRDYPELTEALTGKGKQKRGGDAYPDFLVVNRQTNRVVIVGETKARSTQLELATKEADHYGDAFEQMGSRVLAAGIAGDETSNIGVRVTKRDHSIWKPIVYGKNPIQWLPTPEETLRLIEDDTLFDLQPRVPSAEVLAKRGEQMNRILRECKIKDEFRPAIIGAFMLALWQSKGNIRMSEEHILSDINAACEKAFVKAGKQEIADSIHVPEANAKLASKAPYLCHILRLLNITTLTSAHDYLGQLYETFFRFTGGNTIGQFFTPRHITKFMADITKVSSNDIVLDPACGTGGFLVSALHRLMEGKQLTSAEIRKLVAKHLIGFESEPITAALCVANMILRGDGTTGIIKGDCFTDPAYPEGKATVVLGNPPFPHKKTDDPPEKFIARGLEGLNTRGLLAFIIPSSLLVKPNKKSWRSQVLKNNSLRAAITLPSELFLPYASATTAIALLEKGVPHSPSTETFFTRIENDGFRLKKNARIEQPGDQLPEALDAYDSGDSVPGFCVTKSLDDFESGGEWSPGAYIATPDYNPALLKKEISGLIRSLVAFHSRYAPELVAYAADLEAKKIVPHEYRPKRSRKQKAEDRADRIGSLFDVSYGQKALHNKENLKSGSTLIVSSAGSNNGCYGFFDFPSVISAPFVTVPSTGSIGEAFVQNWPCGVTDDCLLLIPKAELFSKVDEEDLFIAAALVRLERWRFNYGRKITPARISHLKLKRDPALKTWIRQQKQAANELIRDILDRLGSPNRQSETASRFQKLAEQWREATSHVSSVSEISAHPAYLAIIGMGQRALPYIFRSLSDRQSLHWFAALHAITQQNPVPPESAGDVSQMREVWLAWAKKNGYVEP